MPWNKDRPYSPGEMEFHLTGLRVMQGEAPERQLDAERINRSLARHERRHGFRRMEKF